jgi:hypothetical protein
MQVQKRAASPPSAGSAGHHHLAMAWEFFLIAIPIRLLGLEVVVSVMAVLRQLFDDSAKHLTAARRPVAFHTCKGVWSPP